MPKITVITVGPGVERDKRTTIQTKIQALSFALEALRCEHATAPRNPSFDHMTEPGRCKCGYGETIRIVKAIRQELYAQISESRKARKAAKR